MKTEGTKTIGISSPIKNKDGFLFKLNKSKVLLLMVLPTVAFFVIFAYKPMWGLLFAFQRFDIFKGFWGSEWVGFYWFEMFFKNPEFWPLIRNTVLLSVYTLLWSFPAPIIFALALNEVRNLKFKKIVQTVSYLPHFVSTVVIVSMLTMFLSPSTGLINNILASLGLERIYFMGKAEWFRTIYIASSVWQSTGWGSIIYLAAISNVDPQLYESAVLDGANKIKQILHITLPSIAPTLITMLLLSCGHVLSVGFEKVFLLQNPMTIKNSQVISTWVYWVGINRHNYSYATAVGLFNAVVNLITLISANYIARAVNETSLW